MASAVRPAATLVVIFTKSIFLIPRMRETKNLLLIWFSCCSLAALVRMFSPRLSMMPWSMLHGQPLVKWGIAFFVNFLVELVSLSPAYMLLCAFFFMALALMKKRASLLFTCLLGGILAAGVAGPILYEGSAGWSLSKSHHSVELLILYTGLGLFFGGACHYKGLNLPLGKYSL